MAVCMPPCVQAHICVPSQGAKTLLPTHVESLREDPVAESGLDSRSRRVTRQVRTTSASHNIQDYFQVLVSLGLRDVSVY